MLSQHTSDVNSERAFGALKNRYPTWEEVADAPSEEVAQAIRSGGIASLKARRIQSILAAIEEREGVLSLARLRTLSHREARDYLRSLPGVGPKSAACVLVFSLGHASFPVDTHVLRVTTRLGLVSAGASAEAAHEELEPRVPPELRHELHVRMIRHGRAICTARRPRCTACALFDLCDAGPGLLDAGQAR